MKYIPSIAFEEMSGSEKKEDLSRCSGPVAGTTLLRRLGRSAVILLMGKMARLLRPLRHEVPHPTLISAAATKR